VAASNAPSKLARIRSVRFDPTVVRWATFNSPETDTRPGVEAIADDLHQSER